MLFCSGKFFPRFLCFLAMSAIHKSNLDHWRDDMEVSSADDSNGEDDEEVGKGTIISGDLC